MSKYEIKKAQARQQAQEWQQGASVANYSYNDLFNYCIFFEKLGKRYGLLSEFRENGII